MTVAKLELAMSSQGTTAADLIVLHSVHSVHQRKTYNKMAFEKTVHSSEDFFETPFGCTNSVHIQRLTLWMSPPIPP